MGRTIRWLHLTDLHVGMDDQDWLWPRMRVRFREDLGKIYESAGPWDLVLFTGDLVQKGTEYARFDEIFDDIWSWFAELGCDPKLLAVPGNHDLQWRDGKDPVVKMLQKWATDSDVREGFWNEADGKYRQTVNGAFSEYEKWWRDTTRKPGGVHGGLLPGDFAYTFTKGDLRLGIVGLNSAFLQLTEKRGKGNYRGHLTADTRQFHAACGGDGVKWADSHHASFLITHHPPEWLNQQSREHLDGEIIESFCLHLCGHNHQTQVLQELTGGAEHAPLRWLGRSLFGLEKAANGTLDRSHGYVAGELRVDDESDGKLQFMPRRRVPQGGAWSLVPDHDVKLPDDRRTRSFSVPLRTVGVGTGAPQVPDALSSAEETKAIDDLPGSSKVTGAIDSPDAAAGPPAVARTVVKATKPALDDDGVVQEVKDQETAAESAESIGRAAFIAPELLQAVCDQLNSDTEPFRTLRDQLTMRLSERSEDHAEATVGFFVKALAAKLDEVMGALRMWLDSTDRIEEGENVRRLIDALATAGFDAAWVDELVAELEAGHLHVPIETDLHLCEVIFTALYRKPATWIHEKEIDHGAIRAVETPTTKPHERAREIRRRLVETYFRDRIAQEVGESRADYEKRLDRWAEQDLPAALRVERKDQKPWFVLFLETVDALKTEMEIDPALWSQIVKVEKSGQQDRFVCDRPELQSRLVEMHKRLDELDWQARRGPRR